MKPILKIITASVALIVATLLLLRSFGHTPPPAHHQEQSAVAQRAEAAPEPRWKHGQRVPGKYIVVFHDPPNSHARKRSHDDLVGGLAARGVPAEIETRFDSDVLFGAVVHMGDRNNPDGSDEAHAMHKRHLNALPLVRNAEAVRVITVPRSASDEYDDEYEEDDDDDEDDDEADLQDGQDLRAMNMTDLGLGFGLEMERPNMTRRDTTSSSSPTSPSSPSTSSADKTDEPKIPGIDVSNVVGHVYGNASFDNGGNSVTSPTDDSPMSPTGDRLGFGRIGDSLPAAGDYNPDGDSDYDPEDDPDVDSDYEAFSDPNLDTDRPLPDDKQAKRSSKSRTFTSRIDMAHNYTGVAKAHQQGHRGRGAKVAIISDGVRYDHPALGECSSIKDTNCPVSFGADFIGKEFPPSRGYRGDDVKGECNYLGTMLAGVIVGESTAPAYDGVAPDADVGMYRVIDCEGRTDTALVVRALEAAMNDGAKSILVGIPLGRIPGDRFALRLALGQGILAKYSALVFFGVGQPTQSSMLQHNNPFGDLTNVVTVTNAYPGAQVESKLMVKSKFRHYRTDESATREFRIQFYATADRALDKSGWFQTWSLPKEVCDARYPFPSYAGLDIVIIVPDIECMHTQAMHEKMLSRGVSKVIYHLADETFTEDGSANVPNRVPFRAYLKNSLVEAWTKNGLPDIHLVQDDANLVAYTVRPDRDIKWSVRPNVGLGPGHDLGLQPTLAAPGTGVLAVVPPGAGLYAIGDYALLAAAYAAGCAALLHKVIEPIDMIHKVQVLTSKPLPLYGDDGRLGAPMPIQGAGLITVSSLFTVDQAASATKPVIYTTVNSLALGSKVDQLSSFPFSLCTNLNLGVGEYVVFNFHIRPSSSMYFLDGKGRPLKRSPEATVSSTVRFSIGLKQTVLMMNGQSCEKVWLDGEKVSSNLVLGRLPVVSGLIEIKALVRRRDRDTDVVLRELAHSLPYIGSPADFTTLVPFDTTKTYVTAPGSRLRVEPGAEFIVTNTNIAVIELHTHFIIPPERLVVQVIQIGGAGERAATIDGNGLKVVATIFHGMFVTNPDLKRTPIEWNGRDFRGNPVPYGSYQIVVRALRNGFDERDSNNYFYFETPFFRLSIQDSLPI